MKKDLFDSGDDASSSPDTVSNEHQPLAARLRPRSLSEYIGQQHVLGQDKPLRRAIEKGQAHSMILWGPPGVGKTSLAKLFAHSVQAKFIAISAVLAGVKDIRQAVADAQNRRQLQQQGTIVFVDEVHRFNKAQQDAFLPYVEDGTITFIGATTENPSFEVNNALLSRCRVYVLKRFTDDDTGQLIDRAIHELNTCKSETLSIAEDARQLLIQAADGDARRVLNILDIASDIIDQGHCLDRDHIQSVIVGDVRQFDKGGDVFYEQISALHKSVRGSDPDASLYWFARMLDGGCDPLYIARRVVRMASEDIGNADPRALQIALNAWDVQQRLGKPEGELAIAQAIVYLACAAKSNAAYMAYKRALADVQSRPSDDVPMHLRNAPTGLMKGLDYGKSYRYAHDEPDAFAAGESYFPESMGEAQCDQPEYYQPEYYQPEYYQPVPRGLEIQIGEKLKTLRQRNHLARNSLARNQTNDENTHKKSTPDSGEAI